MIDFLNLKQVNALYADEIQEAVQRVIRSGWFLLASETEAFEREYADFCGANHCVGVANGLDALSLALRAMDIGPGDEVIVPSNTFIATWLAVSHVGATPVPVEPDPVSYNVDPARIEAAITERTRAIIPVHLYGQPADMTRVMTIARAHGLRVLEDAAQAHGARHRGVRIGAHGDIVAWSFYPGKNLGAMGDGGAITTNDRALAEKVRLLRNYGSPVKYQHVAIGFNSRLDEVQAAVLRVKLRHLDAANQRRSVIARRYLDGLGGVGLALPQVADGNDPVWHLFVVRHHARDALARQLAVEGVGTAVHYPVPPHLQLAYAPMGLAKGSLPIAEAIHGEVLSLPMGPALSDAQADQVVDRVRASTRLLAHR